MHLYLQGNDFHFECENVCRLFLPLEKITTHHDEDVAQDAQGLCVVCRLEETSDGARLVCRVCSLIPLISAMRANFNCVHCCIICSRSC